MDVLGSCQNFHIGFLVCRVNEMVVGRQVKAHSRDVQVEASEIVSSLPPWPD